MADQKRLFTHYNPIEGRLSKAFFEELPTEAGVYKMYGRKGMLLYVGKAKNLRNRLFTYRRAKMRSTSRKTVRLIRMTHNIDFEICDTEKEALLLENELIRKHQPEFNYAKKQPETYYFIGVQQGKDGLEFSLKMHIPEKDNVFGAFKGHRVIRKSLGGLIRILYILEQRVDSVFQLPSVLTQKLTPMQYTLPADLNGAVMETTLPAIMNYFEGRNMELIDLIMDQCREEELLESFVGSLILDDLESMKWFYERCSHRNYQIRRHLELDSSIIPQQKLDDYLIEWAFAEEE